MPRAIVPQSRMPQSPLRRARQSRVAAALATVVTVALTATASVLPTATAHSRVDQTAVVPAAPSPADLAAERGALVEAKGAAAQARAQESLRAVRAARAREAAAARARAAAVAKARAAAEAKAKAAAAAKARARDAAQRSARSQSAGRAAGGTSWAALNAAIGRIPGYRAGIAKWSVSSAYGHWGVTDLSSGRVYISPSVPASKLYSVAAHEYAHALTSATYGYDWRAADAAMASWFGGSASTARERAADCMALRLGASWTNYTSCSSSTWQQGAARLLQGRRL